MKPLTLGLGLVVVAVNLFAIGCGSDPEDQSAPPPADITRVASSLERKLTAPIAVPTDTAIGGSIDALIEAQTTAVAHDPALNLGASGKRCTVVRYDDDKGAELMRREKCDGSGDTLHVGTLVYIDENNDGKIDQITDGTAGTYELHDDDHDGKLDRMIEGAERIKTPISLSDFGDNVAIMGNGVIASRERQDSDHDGKFDVEMVTATTSFEIRVPAPAPDQTH